MRTAARWMLIMVLLTVLLGSPLLQEAPAGRAAAPRLQSAALSMTTPNDCPFAGCAAGQRLNMRFDFDPSGYNNSLSPNIKMCAYVPTSWNVAPGSVTVDETGQDSGKTYSLPAEGDLGCPQDDETPSGYTLIAERVATLDPNTFADALRFGFRIGPDGSSNGRVLTRIFAQTGTGSWSRVQQASSPTIELVPVAARAFVASDPAACGTANPCYVNSADDLPTGIGTGLKDAVDAASGTDAVVTILSTYTIKSNTVVVNRPLTLGGLGEARITYNGPGACDRGPMLSLNSAVTLRDLTVTDGACTNPDRTLVQVNSSNPVTITGNDLTGGEDAIRIVDNPEANADSRITIRANAINGNSGFAVRALGSTNGVPIEITANNLQGNRSGPAVECGEGANGPVPTRRANHNYWGGGAPGQEQTHCFIDPAKRLGMPAALEPFKAGLRVRLVSVTGTKVYNEELDRQIAYRHTGDGSFPLFIVDHGYASSAGPPFTLQMGAESPSPCSNAWDVFLPEGGSVSGNLELSLKYDRTAGCQAAINSNQYCDQTTTPSLYPLYWLDPRASTPQWITTGSKINASTDGQATTCSIAANEITVSIDNTGRPHIDDLTFVPFMVGVPVIREFLPLASSQTITVTWETNNEPDIVGFYVLRGSTESSLSTISDLIPRRGTALVGSDYSFVDSGKVDEVNYYYRLQVLRADGTSVYSRIIGIAARQATITPTPTIRPTFTLRPSLTPAPTLVSTNIPTRIPTSTTSFFSTSTSAPTPVLQLRTNTPTLDMSLPGARFTATALERTAVAVRLTETAAGPSLEDGTLSPDGTPTATLSPEEAEIATATAAAGETATAFALTPTSLLTTTATPSPTSPPSPFGEDNAWLSLGLGILAGLAAAASAAGAWYFLRLRR